MRATVTLREGIVDGNEIVYEQLTEVHTNYTDLLNPTPSGRTAFESDILGTGWVWSDKNIISIKITED